MKTSPKLFLASLFIVFLFSCQSDKLEQNEKRSYTKSIERISANSFEANLIDMAEKYYPLRDEVVEATVGSGFELPETKYWYYDHFDEVKLPYSITIDAINYYNELIDELNKNKENNFFITANFEYKAELEFYDEYSSPSSNSLGEVVVPEDFFSVYVVKMDLNWENYCGSLCALWIDKERIVVFNESGELLKVFMDGISPVAVS